MTGRHIRSSRRSPTGTRKFGQRYYILAGRGTREDCARERDALLKEWQYARVVPANPYLKRSLYNARDIRLDDYMIYVFGRKA